MFFHKLCGCCFSQRLLGNLLYVTSGVSFILAIVIFKTSDRIDFFGVCLEILFLWIKQRKGKLVRRFLYDLVVYHRCCVHNGWSNEGSEVRTLQTFCVHVLYLFHTIPPVNERKADELICACELTEVCRESILSCGISRMDWTNRPTYKGTIGKMFLSKSKLLWRHWCSQSAPNFFIYFLLLLELVRLANDKLLIFTIQISISAAHAYSFPLFVQKFILFTTFI